MSRFLNAFHKALLPYVPGEQPVDMQYIKLNTNESPFPPSQKVQDCLSAAEIENLRLYPDPECGALVRHFAAYCGMEPENILFGNGSDENLNYCFYAFCGENKRAAFADITYGFYKVFTDLYHIDPLIIPLEEDFSLDTTKYYHCGATVFIANPNAPTGISLPAAAIEKIVQNNPDDVVIVDEAYVDFGAESVVPLVKKYDNLLVVQTYSKSRSLAGGRLGMCIGCKELIDDLKTLKYALNPYNINRLTMAAGIACLQDDSYYKSNCRTIAENRAFLTEALQARGFRVLPSSANFVFAEHPQYTGERLYLDLKAKGILIRHFETARIRNFNRITVGTREQLQALLQTIDSLFEEEHL